MFTIEGVKRTIVLYSTDKSYFIIFVVIIIIYKHNLFCQALALQAKAEKPFFSANHELDSLVSDYINL